MYVIGITGGAGCGKSEAVRFMVSEYGALFISTDEIARKLMERDGSCYRAVLSLFGQEAVDEQGDFKRAVIAERIFHSDYERLALNAVVHPEVKNETAEILAELKNNPENAPEFVIVESALLIEEHYDTICDEIWYIYASEDTRYRRLHDIRGWTDSRIRGIFRTQKKEEEFRSFSDVVFDNDGSFEVCQSGIEERVKEIRQKGVRNIGQSGAVSGE